MKNKKILLILPCNKGAYVGNYFTQFFWNKIDNLLKKEDIRSEVDIAAVDCIITFKKKDNMGALVSEYEMDRVKGYDVHPHEMFSGKHRKENLNLLIDDIKVGLKRLHKKYDKIIVFVNVIPYRLATRKAINDLGLMKKTIFFDWVVYGFGISNILLQYLIKYIKSDKKDIIVKINDRKIYNWKSEQKRLRGINIYEKSLEKFK